MTEIIAIHYCAFCDSSSQDEKVDVLIVAYKESPTGICGMCVDLCARVVAEKGAEDSQEDESTSSEPAGETSSALSFVPGYVTVGSYPDGLVHSFSLPAISRRPKIAKAIQEKLHALSWQKLTAQQLIAVGNAMSEIEKVVDEEREEVNEEDVVTMIGASIDKVGSEIHDLGYVKAKQIVRDFKAAGYRVVRAKP